MDAGKVIFQLLIDNAELGLIVGDKIYPMAMAEDRVYPSVVYGTDDGLINHKDGGIFDGRIKIDVYAYTYSQAKQIANLIQATLNRYEGILHDTNVHWLGYESGNDGFVDELKLHHVSQDYKMIAS